LEKAIADAEDDDAEGILTGRAHEFVTRDDGELQEVDEGGEQAEAAGPGGSSADDDGAFASYMVSEASEEDQSFFDDLVARMGATKIDDTSASVLSSALALLSSTAIFALMHTWL